MAKLYKMKNRGLYQVQFKNPEKIGTKNPWDREYHNNKKQAKARKRKGAEATKSVLSVLSQK